MLTIFKAHPVQQAMSAAAAPADLNEAGFRRNPGEPDAAQAEDGEYRKPRVQWRGLTIAIENPAGSVRRGRNRHGVSWEIRMRYDYGEVVGSMGVDGDPVDIYLGPHLEDAPMVYVVHQRRVNDWDAYDEDKAMAGFLTETDAAQAFLSNYNDPRFLGPITAMPVDEFVAKVRATREKPAMIKALFLKTHVNTYTKKDGTVVAAHEDKRAEKHEPEVHSDAWGGEGVVDAIQAEIDDDPHADWGLRVIPHGHPVSVGDELPPSYRWEDGEQTEDELDGTSAIGIRANGGVQRAIKVLNQGGYSGAQVALVRGESQGAGEDPGEILLSDAEVVKVWNRGTQMTKSTTPVLLFFKGYVGPYLRGGRIVNIAGYHGRSARATASPGQLSLFGSNEPLPPSPLKGKDPVASTPDLFDEPTHTEPTRELIAEHERLVDVLNSPSHADDKTEAKKQAEELKEMKDEAGVPERGFGNKPTPSQVMKQIDDHNDSWSEIRAVHGSWIKDRGVVRKDAPEHVREKVKAHKAKSVELKKQYDEAIARFTAERKKKAVSQPQSQKQESQTERAKRLPYASKEDLAHLFGKDRGQPRPKPASANVTPQVPSARQLDGMIKIAADSIDQLRKPDVDRVISETPAHFRLALASHIKTKRPDLAEEVNDVMSDLGAPMTKSIIFLRRQPAAS